MSLRYQNIQTKHKTCLTNYLINVDKQSSQVLVYRNSYCLRLDELSLVSGCEYGDRGTTCDAATCPYYDTHSRDVVCCGTCAVATTPTPVLLKRRNQQIFLMIFSLIIIFVMI